MSRFQAATLQADTSHGEVFVASDGASDRKQGARQSGRRAPDALTPAEARALSRSAPLTPGEFRALGRVAGRRVDSLRAVLRRRGVAEPVVGDDGAAMPIADPA